MATIQALLSLIILATMAVGCYYTTKFFKITRKGQEDMTTYCEALMKHNLTMEARIIKLEEEVYGKRMVKRT